MSPVMADPGSFPAPGILREKLNGAPGDNLLRNDLAVSLYFNGQLDEALAVIDAAPANTPGAGLILINRLYLRETKAALDALEKQKKEDLGKRIHKIVPAAVPSPAVSIIMPTYNRAEKIRESALTAVAQTRKDFELVIVNDGGDPQVEAVVRSIGSDKITFIDAEHKGLAGALNLGIHAARGRYIARLDDDDLYRPDHVKKTAGFLDSHPEVHAVYAVHETQIQQLEDGEYVPVRTTAANVPEWDLAAFRWKMFFTSNNVVARREVFREVGPYNEYFPTREDWELYLRVAERFGFTRIPHLTSTYIMRRDASNMTTADPTGFHHYANLAGFIHRLYSITSSLWLPYGATNRRVKNTIAALDSVMALDESAIKPVYVKKLELLKSKKPYTFFMEWSKNLHASRELKELALPALRAARRLSPFEPGPIRAFFFRRP